MKTLYISDLDGTLLNKSVEITTYAKEIINRITENGGYFTVATARTLDTVLHILGGVRLNVPAVLLNGVSVYDTLNRRYEKIETIETSALSSMFKKLSDFGITGFVYALENGDIAHYYENLDSEHRKAFHDDRSGKYGRIYTQVKSFSELCEKGDDKKREIAYFSTCDNYDVLFSVYKQLKTDSRLHIEFYRDIYHTDFWYLEICSANASKYNAVMFLKEKYGFDRIVAFGDNLNDIPLFRASDECYAVANAKSEVKEIATAVIESNDDNGVAKRLDKLWRRITHE
jgi:Cof subfamily protein (haloacid dehalogenase superfamily)